MDKLRMESPDMTAQNIDRIAALFPNCITEMLDEEHSTPEKKVYKRAVNFELLKQMLSPDVVDGDEAYEFTWVGKKAAIVEANKPIRKTLRPCVAESKDWDTTENLYIEGDNLDALKLLQETYLGKVKMIYIDPPYNTGNDFIYEDDFSQKAEDYAENSGQTDEEGNRLVQNSESNGRFHTDWLNMLYPRLRIAKDLLTDDGVIFISIDDNEQENLKKICNEIFGKQNFEGHIHWRRRHNQPNDKTKMIGLVAEHILTYAKDSVYLKSVGVGKLDLTASFKNPDNDPNGPWASKPWKVGSDQSGSKYEIVTPTGKVLDGEWMGEEATYKKFLAEGRIYFPKGGDGMPRKKYYQFEREEEGQCATNWWPHEQFGNNQEANNQMAELFGIKNIFSNPKPVKLIRAMIKIANVNAYDICMDFFSGSATTAHALMELNAEERRNRKFILVQLPETPDKKSEAYKAGYKTICDIGEERIRRAGKKIKEETGADIDYCCRFFRVDSSNMKDVYYKPSDVKQGELDLFTDNIKEDRTPEDLLIQVMLDLGVLLSSKVEEEEMAGKKVFSVADGYLIACFDRDVTDDVVTAIARKHPFYAVFRDSSFSSDSVAANFEQIFDTYSPQTVRKVL